MNISSKTGGINDIAGYYVSACCRGEVFLEEKATKPRCPECGKTTDWGMTLRRAAAKPASRSDARRDERHLTPESLPRVSRVEWGGFGLDDVKVVNYSQTGIAVEVSDPAIFFGAATLTLENGEVISGVIRHCRQKDGRYVLGIVYEMNIAALCESTK